MPIKVYVKILQEVELTVIQKCNKTRAKHKLPSLSFHENCEIEICRKDCPLYQLLS